MNSFLCVITILLLSGIISCGGGSSTPSGPGNDTTDAVISLAAETYSDIEALVSVSLEDADLDMSSDTADTVSVLVTSTWADTDGE